MKTNRVELKTSNEDEALIRKAAEKFTAETGKKGMTSRAIFQAVEEYVNTEPELFFCNRQSIQETELHIEAGRQLLQNVYNEFKAVTGFELTLEQLQTILAGKVAHDGLRIMKQDIPDMVTSLIYGEQKKKYPELNFSIEQVKIPDTTSILDAATSVMLPSIGRQLNVPPYWQAYNLSEGKVTVNPVEVDKLCEAYRIYAVTPEERAKLFEVKKLCRMLDGFVKNVSFGEKLNIPMVCYYDRISGRMEPDETYIKYKI